MALIMSTKQLTTHLNKHFIKVHMVRLQPNTFMILQDVGQ